MSKKLITMKDGIAFTDSLVIANGVGIEHRAVIQLLNAHNETETLSTFEMVKVSTKGRPVEVALLTEVQATFLITLMRNSPKVVEFKEKLTLAFFKQRGLLDEQYRYVQTRLDGKEVYKQKTAVIKDFIEYAEKQGSKSAHKYYMALANMENQSLFMFEQKYPNLREMMTIKQLMLVSSADAIIEKAIVEGMESGMFYKDIFQMAKGRIIKFAELVGISPILELNVLQY